VNVSVSPVEPATTDVGDTVRVPLPSGALVSVTVGETANAVVTPGAVDFSVVVNVDVPATAGEAAPRPPEEVDP
jgi:hypothetical protein